MIRVVEEGSGAQVLPPIADQRATVTGYQVHCAADSDLRAKSMAYRSLAGRLVVEIAAVQNDA